MAFVGPGQLRNYMFNELQIVYRLVRRLRQTTKLDINEHASFLKSTKIGYPRKYMNPQYAVIVKINEKKMSVQNTHVDISYCLQLNLVSCLFFVVVSKKNRNTYLV